MSRRLKIIISVLGFVFFLSVLWVAFGGNSAFASSRNHSRNNDISADTGRGGMWHRDPNYRSPRQYRRVQRRYRQSRRYGLRLRNSRRHNSVVPFIIGTFLGATLNGAFSGPRYPQQVPVYKSNCETAFWNFTRYGRTRLVFGTACLQHDGSLGLLDGSWHFVN